VHRAEQAAVFQGFDGQPAARGPFASDRFTVADHTQNTGRRVNLPLPNPVTNPSDYQDTQVLNTLDGFNLQPRLSIPFDGPIDVNTVTSQTVFQISLGDTLPGGDPGGDVVGINQIVWDPAGARVTNPARRPSAGAVPGRWGACLAARTSPAARLFPRPSVPRCLCG
jgi:hypothetical protein